MALHHTAQGLAGLGRNGDSVLVHMQPQEVAGLQALAQSRGTSLTVNPDTGMPEAFNLGDFFSSFLPTIVGAAFAPATGGFSLTPLLAGAATGAGLAKIKGEDPLLGGLMGGLGGYGGSKLGTALSAAGPGGFVPTQAAALTDPQLLASTVTPSMMTNPAILNPAANASIAQAAQNIGTQAAQSGVLNTLKSGAGNFMTTAGDTLSQGAKNLSNSFQGLTNISGLGNVPQAEAYKAFTDAGGSMMQLGLPVGAAVLDGLEPSDLGLGGPSIDDLQRKTKYRGPLGQLNLDANYNQDTGQYEGLPSLQLAAGGAISGAGNYYGARTTSGGNQDLYGSSDNAAANTQLSQDGYGIGRLDKLAQQGSLTKAGDMFYAAGGPVSFADGGDTESSMNLEGLPSLNLETGRQSGASMGGEFGGLLGALMNSNPAFASQIGMSGNAAPPKFAGLLGAIFKDNPDLLKQLGVKGSQYAQGGYLDGPGDGLSDSIPATIEGKQPARLADGEFVVSSDVVSGLGNGSSKAGAKKLYAMMDRVRQQAHGTKKQIRKVNEKKVMPDLA